MIDAVNECFIFIEHKFRSYNPLASFAYKTGDKTTVLCLYGNFDNNYSRLETKSVSLPKCAGMYAAISTRLICAFNCNATICGQMLSLTMVAENGVLLSV